ncbi:MAG: NADP-dependent malic enzyme [Synergistales bacterium]|nr:NADP-dependent malic enzyme [Synergistales bacterium]
MTVDKLKALELHRKARGKIRNYPTINVRNEDDMAMVYVPGSVFPAREIIADKANVYEYTGKKNRLAVITDGSATLGLGNIGPHASLPVMEGKCLLFKTLADINAFPICLDSQDVNDIIHAVQLIAPSFGAINIEDVAAPNTFTAVRELNKHLDIPVVSDDQHGTAVMILAALWSALDVTGKKLEDVKIVILGAGAAGIATSELLLHVGARNIIAINRSGILGPDNQKMNHYQEELSTRINPEGIRGALDEAIQGADVFIGFSINGRLTQDQVKKMNGKAIVFALARPEPEIMPEEAIAAGAAIAGSSLFDSINPLPNLLSYPGICRGLLDVRATGLNRNILASAAEALKKTVDGMRLCETHILPDLFSDEVTPRMAEVVAQKTIEEGLAIIRPPKGQVYDETWQRLFGGPMTRL